MVVVGGSAFALLFLRPLMLKNLEPAVAMGLMGAIQARFRWVIWIGIVILIVTGAWMSGVYRGITDMDGLTATSFGQALSVKSLLSLLLYASALSITLPWGWLGWFRVRQLVFMRLNLVLATVIVLLAALLVRNGGLS